MRDRLQEVGGRVLDGRVLVGRWMDGCKGWERMAGGMGMSWLGSSKTEGKGGSGMHRCQVVDVEGLN